MKWEGLKSLGGVEIDQNGSEGVKQKDFLLVVVIQPSIIKQFEQMSTSLKLLKRLFFWVLLEKWYMLNCKIYFPGQV